MRKLLILFFLISATTTFAQSWGQGAIRILAGTGITVSFNNGDYTLSSTAVAPAGSVDSTSIVDLSVASTDLANGLILNAKYANGSITVNKFASTVYPAIRGKVGWTSNGTITGDTVTTRIEWGGTPNTSVKIFDADGDTVSTLPQGVATKYVWLYKDGATILAAVDSLGYLYSQALDQISSGNMIIGNASLTTELQFNSAGNFTYNNWLKAPDMLEFLGGALKETPTTGASDTTANYMPLKAFSVGDTATFDFSTGKRFTTLDSIVVLAYSNTATSSVVFNCQIRQVQIGGAIAGAFNASSSKTIATGTAGTLRQWSFTSFGSVTASVYSQIVGKIFRTAGGTGGDVFVTRVLLYGVGLR